MKMRMLVALFAVVGLLVGTTTATTAQAGHSTDARACQADGWQTLDHSDGRPFANQGDCVSYAARGGVLTSRYPAAESLCESFEGSFGHKDHSSADPTRLYLWTCNDLPADFPFPSGNDQLALQCFADGGVLFSYRPDIGTSTCFAE
jgi:hypothetical protein